MTRISRISTPRATLFAIALITVVMLTFGAFSAEEAAGAPEGISVLAGEPVTNGECQPPTSPQPGSARAAERRAGAVPLAREAVPPCPHAASQGETQAFTGTETE